MINLLTNNEKAEYVATIKRVAEAPEQVWTGRRYSTKGHYSSTAQGSREYERRYLTDQELDELMDCYDQIEADYRKRLDAYWKRYRSNITSVGYWANR